MFVFVLHLMKIVYLPVHCLDSCTQLAIIVNLLLDFNLAS